LFQRIALVGGGAMAEAIVRGLLSRRVLGPRDIITSDPNEHRRSLFEGQYGTRTTSDNASAAGDAGLVVLAVKPQQIGEAIASLRGTIHDGQIVLSIAAGVPLRRVIDGLPHDRVVRVMPNAPAQVGAAMSVWTSTDAVTADDRAAVRHVLQALGREMYVPDESYLDMATAINGSGPGFVFLFIEAMIDAAVHIGMARPVAEELVLQTVLGSAQMARDTGQHPAQLRNMVTSAGGTTAAGLFALEDGRFRTVVDRAVAAAFQRSRELGG
jgi:pyrroline-5-carboxylate reductase